MKTCIATSGNRSCKGGWYACLYWANDVISEIPDADTTVKIHRIRGGEKTAVIVAEVTSEGVRIIELGRIVPLRSLLKNYDG